MLNNAKFNSLSNGGKMMSLGPIDQEISAIKVFGKKSKHVTILTEFAGLATNLLALEENNWFQTAQNIASRPENKFSIDWW
jgi:hypothetical protein